MSYRPHPTIKGAWQIDVYINGKRERLRFDGTESDCMVWHDELLRQYRSEPLPTDFVNIAAIWPTFLLSYQLTVEASTLTDCGWCWKRLQPHFGHLKYTALTRSVFEQYQKARLNAGVSHRTINRELSYFSSFWKWSVERGYCEPAPFKVPKFAKKLTRPKIPNVLSPDETIAFCNAFGLDRVPCIELMGLCGLRSSEALNVQCDDLRGNSLRILGKGNKERIVPVIDPILLAQLTTIKETRKTGLMFPDMPKDMRKAFRGAERKAGLPPNRVRPHLLRHTALTNLVLSSANIVAVQSIAGHANLATTMIYTHINPEWVRTEAEKSLTMLVNKNRPQTPVEPDFRI